jgi:hypothetical protein
VSILICNVGGADLICAALPKDRRGERAWAEEVLERYAELRPALHLPIIGKALDYLAARDALPAMVLLIASDQVPEAGQRFFESDTRTTAAIIARVLADGYGALPPFPAAHIASWIISDADEQGCDPSDYDAVLAFLERRLPELAVAWPQGSVFLEVTGGTPAMTTGLLIAGTEVFGARAEVLSVHPRRATPAAIKTGQRLLAAPLRATLRTSAAVFAYDAALATFTANRAAICDRLPAGRDQQIEALLRYAHRRYNFDFAGAREEVRSQKSGVRSEDDISLVFDEDGIGATAAVFFQLAADVAAPTRKDLLAEVYHGAAARYETGLYADFLTQLVRFEENLLRLLCLERGATFVSRNTGDDDDDGSLISRTWLRTLPFALSRDRDDGRDLASSRALLFELLGLLAQEHGENLRTLLADIERLRPLVYLRNELTHSLDGVRRVDLAQRFSGRRSAAEHEAEGILPHLAALYRQIAGVAPPPSPYTTINTLLERLLLPGLA